MSAIAEHRHLVDIMRPLAPAPRPPASVVCPRCGCDSVHVGPNGRYCERGECEWEAWPGSVPVLPIHTCALPPCFICGQEAEGSYFAPPFSRHSLGLLPMCRDCLGSHD